MSAYLELTREFNAGGTRAVLSSGQAVVMHGLALMSKDGDWILAEDRHDLEFILGVLDSHGARYRFGAPLDVRWMSGGWSSHFQFHADRLRVRTDFVTRPPRLTAPDLHSMWLEQRGREVPYLDARRLASIKQTNREKDYPVIGELARLLQNPLERLMYSRSARDILRLASLHPDLVAELVHDRPALRAVEDGRDALEVALDGERRQQIRANEKRLEAYFAAAEPWMALWPRVDREMRRLGLLSAHALMVERATGVLPFRPNLEDV